MTNIPPFQLDEKGQLQIDMQNPNILSYKEKKNVTTIKYSWVGLDKNHHSKVYKNTVYIVRDSEGKPTNIEKEFFRYFGRKERRQVGQERSQE